MPAVNLPSPADFTRPNGFNGPTEFNGPNGFNGPFFNVPGSGAAPGSSRVVVPQATAGSATPESPFGDVLSHSINSNSAAAPHSTDFQSAHAQSAGTQPDNISSGRTGLGNAPDGPSRSPETQPGTAQSSPKASPSGDAPKPPTQNSDCTASSPAKAGVPTDQASLLAACYSGAVHASSGQPAPSDPANSQAAKPAQSPAPGVGAAPAQLVNNLLQADSANGNGTGAATTGPSQGAPGTNGETTGDVNAPQALIAGVQQAANRARAQSQQTPGGLSAAAAPDANAGRNAVTATDKAAAASAADQDNALAGGQSAPDAAKSTGLAADLADLVTLVPTSKTSSTTATSETALGGKGSGTVPSVGAADAFSLPPAAVSTTTTAAASSVSQSSLTSGAGVPAGQQLAWLPAGPAALVGNTFADNAARQSAAIQSASAGSLPALAQLSTPVLPSASATSSTSALDANNPAQLGATDAGQAAQQQGSQNPGYLFGTAPPSLQWHVMNVAAGQTASTGSLTSLVLDQAAYAIQYSHVNGQQMQLHLNPPELGALQVNVSMHNGVLSARIEAQTATAQQILTDNISQLKDSLTRQGVSFDRIDVHLSGSNSGSGGGTADKSFAQQQDGGIPWNQQFVQPENDDTAPRATAPAVRGSRAPLTSLDIMA